MLLNWPKLFTLDFRTNILKTNVLILTLCLLIPILFSITPTTTVQAAIPGELFMPLISIFAFGNIFLPEQTADITAVINSKPIQLKTIYALRFGWSLIFLSIINSLLILIYLLSTANLNLGLLWADFLVKPLFIGSLAALSYRLCHFPALAYLIPTAFLALCIGYPHLGVFNLLTIMNHQGWLGIISQLIAGILFLIISFTKFKKQPFA